MSEGLVSPAGLQVHEVIERIRLEIQPLLAFEPLEGLGDLGVRFEVDLTKFCHFGAPGQSDDDVSVLQHRFGRSQSDHTSCRGAPGT